MGVNEMGWKGLDWISLAQDGEKMARCGEHNMDVSVSKNARNF